MRSRVSNVAHGVFHDSGASRASQDENMPRESFFGIILESQNADAKEAPRAYRN